MTADPRAALDRLVASLEAHFDAISSRRSEDDPRIDNAYAVLADAFEVYDEALDRVYGEMTPFMLDDDSDDVDSDDDDDLDDLDDDDLDIDGVDD
ncbi:MAG: primosomal protein [Cellulomonadaceae bacterium]|jgi:alpha-L-fucosidase|nr:primosomal protein [Cellulomonadaceae bacterium]